MNPIDIKPVWVQGSGVPGGHYVIDDGTRKPFAPPMKEPYSLDLRHSDVVVDIGAYVGTFAIRCARYPVKKVTAYEPTPRTFEILKMSKQTNLELVNAAVVGDDRAEVTLHISGGIGVTNSIAKSNKKIDAITVPAVNYAEAVRGASIVKVDVEGAEYGFPLIQPSIRGIAIDFHPMTDREWIKDAMRIIEELQDNGFRAIISPNFDNGWTRAGSWIRPMHTDGEYEPMMNGQECCGCGKPINGKGMSLCKTCYARWTPKHRVEFHLATE